MIPRQPRSTRTDPPFPSPTPFRSLISGAIDKYVYILAHTVFQKRYRMKYSETEEVDTAAEIKHPIFRERLLKHWRGNPLEIAVVADVPAGRSEEHPSERPSLMRITYAVFSLHSRNEQPQRTS